MSQLTTDTALVEKNQREKESDIFPLAPFFLRSAMDQTMSSFFLFWFATALALLNMSCVLASTGVEGAIGVNYGLKGGNLPPPHEVISLYQSRNIKKLRLFNPDATVLAALQNSGIEVVLGTLNSDLQPLSTDTSYATNWVSTNVVPYAETVKFRYITAGNEVIPGDLMKFVLPAMRNLDLALRAVNSSVPVSTAVASDVLGASYPPSQGVFSEKVAAVMMPIAAFLQAKKAPLLVNVYPYFAYSGNPRDISLGYALFSSNSTVVKDGTLRYTNLFDAMVDAVNAALEKVNAPEVDLVVSETGWPSAGGGPAATLENAKTYNNHLVSHVTSGKGTPRRPGKVVETYLFAMFNEDQKPGLTTEQHFGLYQPDMTEVYHVDFTG